MRAIYQPAELRRRTRIALSLGGLMISGLMLVLGIGLTPDASGLLLMALGTYLLPLALHVFFALKLRPSAGPVRIECHPGYARLASGLKLKPADVLGASTTLHDKKYLLHLYMKDAAHPHTLVFDTEDDVSAFRRSLGLKHDGTGFLEWPTTRGSELWLGIVAGLGGMICSMSSLLLLFWTFFPYRSLRGANIIAMRPDGLFIPTVAGNLGTHIRYADIATIEPQGGSGLLLKTTSGHMVRIPGSNLSAEEWRRIGAQLSAASRRARGERTERERPLDRVMQIQRGEGETLGSWLARLEASSMHADYRGGGLDPSELMRVTEDMDESPLNRLAAARLLHRMQRATPASAASAGATLAVQSGPAAGTESPAGGAGNAKVRVDEALANLDIPERLVRIALESEGTEAAEAFAEVNAEVLRRRTFR